MGCRGVRKRTLQPSNGPLRRQHFEAPERFFRFPRFYDPGHSTGQQFLAEAFLLAAVYAHILRKKTFSRPCPWRQRVAMAERKDFAGGVLENRKYSGPGRKTIHRRSNQ